MRISVRLLLILLLFISFLPREALSQDATDSRKLKQINFEIQQFEQQKKSGMLMVGAGVGLYILGWVLFLPSTELNLNTLEFENKGNDALWTLSILTGLGLEIYGGYQWWDASQQLALLRTKRYDFTFTPTIIIPDSKSAIAFGAKVSVGF